MDQAAALASAGSFTVGAVLPLLLVFFVPLEVMTWIVSGSSLLFLASLGGWWLRRETHLHFHSLTCGKAHRTEVSYITLTILPISGISGRIMATHWQWGGIHSFGP